VIRRGAVEIVRDPLQVTWRGKIVPLSPMEMEIFATIAVRGRATTEAIDRLIEGLGRNANSRRVAMMRIRQKFRAIGAADPLEAINRSSFRFRVEPNEDNSTATVIGLQSAG
jgi:DNA-binding response OmpR family regulator